MTDELAAEQFTFKNFVKYEYPFWGPFFMQSTMKEESIKILLDKGNESRAKGLDHSHDLAGDLDHEFYYDEIQSWFPEMFQPYIDAYLDGVQNTWSVRLSDEYPTNENRTNDNITHVGWNIRTLWINYMQARDFNPPHNHSGDLSFVIFLDVPAELKEEYLLNKDKRNNSGPGVIQFTHGTAEQYLSINQRVYFPETGMVLLFPAWLKHYVIGYRSEVERISVSGNIHLNVA